MYDCEVNSIMVCLMNIDMWNCWQYIDWNGEIERVGKGGGDVRFCNYTHNSLHIFKTMLANWEQNCALNPTDENPENSGKWIVTVNLPANVKFEWKWVVVWRENHNAFRWEERANRVTEVGEESCKCHAPWNEDTTYKTLPQVSGTSI